jgi:hypothetical protein
MCCIGFCINEPHRILKISELDGQIPLNATHVTVPHMSPLHPVGASKACHIQVKTKEH